MTPTKEDIVKVMRYACTIDQKCEKCLCLQACYRMTTLTIKKWERLRLAKEREAWEKSIALMNNKWKSLYEMAEVPFAFPKPIKPKKVKKECK